MPVVPERDAVRWRTFAAPTFRGWPAAATATGAASWRSIRSAFPDRLGHLDGYGAGGRWSRHRSGCRRSDIWVIQQPRFRGQAGGVGRGHSHRRHRPRGVRRGCCLLISEEFADQQVSGSRGVCHRGSGSDIGLGCPVLRGLQCLGVSALVRTFGDLALRRLRTRRPADGDGDSRNQSPPPPEGGRPGALLGPGHDRHTGDSGIDMLIRRDSGPALSQARPGDASSGDGDEDTWILLTRPGCHERNARGARSARGWRAGLGADASLALRPGHDRRASGNGRAASGHAVPVRSRDSFNCLTPGEARPGFAAVGAVPVPLSSVPGTACQVCGFHVSLGTNSRHARMSLSGIQGQHWHSTLMGLLDSRQKRAGMTS